MRDRRFYAYARHALVTALHACGVGPGSTVLIPELVCRDVLASTRAVGATVAFYPLDERLQVAPGHRFAGASAALAVNYFGFPADLDRLRESVDGDTTIIEDNAHGWLSATEEGIALGARTALGVTSFRKTILSPDGAYLEWDPEVFPEVPGADDDLAPRRDPLPPAFRLRSVAGRAERALHLPVRHGVRTVTRLGRRMAGRPSIDDRPEEEFVLPVHRAVHRESLRRFRRLDAHDEIGRRRRMFERCLNLAREHDVTPVHRLLPPGIAPQGFPFFRGGDERRFRARVDMARLGEVMTWPALPESTTLAADSPLRSLRLVNFLR